jgi:hypothetical protein
LLISPNIILIFVKEDLIALLLIVVEVTIGRGVRLYRGDRRPDWPLEWRRGFVLLNVNEGEDSLSYSGDSNELILIILILRLRE